MDARDLDPGTALHAQVCVVGAGAAGITVAHALAESGVDVCLVESGGFDPEEKTQQLYDVEHIGYPVRENFMSRARYYGGSCNVWAGRSMRLEPADIDRRDWVANSGWPLSYGELAAYYPQAAEILRLPPLARFERDGYRDRMSEQERHLFSSEPLRPTISLWAKGPMRFSAAYRAWLRQSSRVRLVLHANVTKIVLRPDGIAVQSLEASTLGGKRFTLRANTYVLACGGLENARLLLVSRDTHTEGVGNHHDVVGRYFMDHPRAVAGRVRLYPGCRLALLPGQPLQDGKIQLGIGLSAATQQADGLLNHYATLEAEFSQYVESGYQSFVRTMKVLLRKGHAGSRWSVGRARLGYIPGMIYLLTPKELLPHAIYRWHTALRRALHPRPHGRSRVVVYFCEQPPDAASRVTLSPQRDALGMPRLVVDWRLGSEITRSILRLQELLREGLRRSGIGELEPAELDVRFSDASHHMGTTRMSGTPRKGVVDVDCRVHGVVNLYLGGSSVFPSGGHANPTLTIVGLALRLANHIRARCG